MERIETLSDTLAIWDKQIKEEEMIASIRVHANMLYNKGWDVVVECYDDGDLLEELSENGMSLSKTLISLQEMVDCRNDRKEEQEAEARSSY
jgi:hypothetical protein